MSRTALVPAFLLAFALVAACGGETTDGNTGDQGGAGTGAKGGTGGTGGTGGSCSSNGSAGANDTGPDRCAKGGTGGTGGAGGTGGTGGSGGTVSAGAGGSDTVVRAPKNHRAVATPCDDVRDVNEPNVTDSGPQVACKVNAECTAGVNGRCTGNSHDGWACTYDLCKDDAACGGGVCACEGGFRADNNVCLKSSCRVDADCGANGFCSPSLGDCGHYTKFVTYACHTPQDECVDDEDCEKGGYCAFQQSVGHWKCSTAECVG